MRMSPLTLAISVSLLAPVTLALAQDQAPSPAPPTAASYTSVVPAMGNSALTGQIMQRLSDDPVLRNVSVTASVGHSGEVVLNGVVPTQSLNDRAVDVVKSVPGVNKVDNQILINQDPFAPAAAEGNASAPIAATPAPPAAASEPQALIADAISKHPELDRVLATVYDNKVVLSGTVANRRVENEAVQIVRQVEPKMRVTNTIWINPQPTAPPPQIPKQ